MALKTDKISAFTLEMPNPITFMAPTVLISVRKENELENAQIVR